MNFMEHSRRGWANIKKTEEYPGDTEIVIGCLQRIAAAMERIADEIAGPDSGSQNESSLEEKCHAEARRWFEEREAMRGPAPAAQKRRLLWHIRLLARQNDITVSLVASWLSDRNRWCEARMIGKVGHALLVAWLDRTGKRKPAKKGGKS